MSRLPFVFLFLAVVLAGCRSTQPPVADPQVTIDSLQTVVTRLEGAQEQLRLENRRLIIALDTASQALDRLSFALQESLAVRLEDALTARTDSLRHAAVLACVRGLEQQDLRRGETLEIVYFEPGSTQLSAAAAAELDRIVPRLRALSATQAILVEGHSDDTPFGAGNQRNNRVLSAERAAAVIRYLVDRHGLPEARLEAAGYGADRPLVPNDRPEHRRINRRVRIAVL